MTAVIFLLRIMVPRTSPVRCCWRIRWRDRSGPHRSLPGPGRERGAQRTCHRLQRCRPAVIAAQQLFDIPEDQRMQRFVQQLVRPRVELPPLPPSSDDPEMAKRPAGVASAGCALRSTRKLK